MKIEIHFHLKVYTDGFEKIKYKRNKIIKIGKTSHNWSSRLLDALTAPQLQERICEACVHILLFLACNSVMNLCPYRLQAIQNQRTCRNSRFEGKSKN